MNHRNLQAEAGKKFLYGPDSPRQMLRLFDIYLNECLIGGPNTLFSAGAAT
jgi:hypothetical protein